MLMEQAGVITIALFMIGVIYQAGRLSVRVEKLEEWQRNAGPKLDAILAKLNHVCALGEERGEQ